MEDRVALLDQRLESQLGEIVFAEGERVELLRALEVSELDLGGVVVDEGVHADHLVAVAEQRLRELRADEARAAGDERPHRLANRRHARRLVEDEAAAEAQPPAGPGRGRDEELDRLLDAVVRGAAVGVVERDPEPEAAVHDREAVELEAEHALAGRAVPTELGGRLDVRAEEAAARVAELDRDVG